MQKIPDIDASLILYAGRCGWFGPTPRATIGGLGSPIEQDFLAYFIIYGRLEYFCETAIVEAGFTAAAPGTIQIMPQMPFQGYRIDFAIAGQLFVECDGHDFHERTPDQAMHDRRRDRACALAGIPVIRFTGREIHSDPWRCAGEAWLQVNKMGLFKPRGGTNGANS